MGYIFVLNYQASNHRLLVPENQQMIVAVYFEVLHPRIYFYMPGVKR
jgi:hypothetical protein